MLYWLLLVADLPIYVLFTNLVHFHIVKKNYMISSKTKRNYHMSHFLPILEETSLVERVNYK